MYEQKINLSDLMQETEDANQLLFCRYVRLNYKYFLSFERFYQVNWLSYKNYIYNTIKMLTILLVT